jgi:hypothetical protein
MAGGMTDRQGRGDPHESRGVQAYRWIMLFAIAALGFLSTRIYERIDKTAEAVGIMERSITALNGRLDAQAERLADHDRRLGRLESPFFGPRPN